MSISRPCVPDGHSLRHFQTALNNYLRTSRLRLRPWHEADLAPFAALNADPRVMEHFPACLTREESESLVGRIEAHFEANGYGLWAVEIKATSEFIGFTGLSIPSFQAHFTPAVEVGWRLARSAWGHGYATEAARMALDFAFDQAGLEEVVSFTTPFNLRSQAVMRRLGMRHNPADDFDHPAIAPGHRLRRHVLYRIASNQWHSITLASSL